MRLATTAVSPAHPAAKLLVPDRSTVVYAVASSAPPTASRIPDIIFLAVTEQSAITVHNQNPRPPGQQSYTTISRLLPAALTYAHRLPFFALPFCVSRICSGVSPACNSGRSTAPASRLPPAWSLAAVLLHRCISSADAVHHVARRVHNHTPCLSHRRTLIRERALLTKTKAAPPCHIDRSSSCIYCVSASMPRRMSTGLIAMKTLSGLSIFERPEDIGKL